jgi:hypothetical protein
MVDVNDPAFIETMTFLLVPKEERIQTAARPFDSKKNVFVKDAKEGYLPAEVQSDDGKQVTVKKEGGEVI